MRKLVFVLFACVIIMPGLAIAANSPESQGNSGSVSSVSSTNSNDSAVTSSASDSNQIDPTSSSAAQSANRVQIQAGNPGVGAMTAEQTEARIKEQISESKPAYAPRNEQASLRMSSVATAVEELVRVSNRFENPGIGEQVREIAQVQVKNQDKVNQAIDKAETRTKFAKFFIGSNYKELKTAKEAMKENQSKARELKELMAQADNDADKLTIANQIMTLQEENLALRDQIEQSDDSFSLFGWLSRLINKY
ncbi:MAG: hypothetical protein WC107_00935 [Patescibacteria group bacterium]